MRRLELRLFTEVLIGFGIALLLLGAVSVVSLATYESMARARARAQEIINLRENIELSLSLLKDVEAGARDYALTGNRRFLAPYYNGNDGLDQSLARATGALAADPARADDARRFDHLTRRAADNAGELVALVDSKAPSRARRDELLGEGLTLMNETRALANALIIVESGALAEQDLVASSLTKQAREAIRVVVALAVGFMVLGALFIRREIALRERLSERIRTRERQLESILDNMPALVYVKHGDGRYLFANRRFRRLLGSRHEAAAGKTDEAFFPPETAVAFKATDAEVALTGRTIEREETFPGAEGSRSYLALRFPLPSFDGERLTCGIMMDITERKRTDSLKEEVLALATHELRTPLTTILGALRYATTEIPLPMDAAELLGMALRSGKHMLNVVNNYLDLAEIERGGGKFEREEVDLCALASEAAASMKTFAVDKHLRYVVRTRGPVLVKADGERLREVIDNLLSNAAKFSPERAEVELDVSADKGHCRLTVRDHGPGIRKEFAPRVFSKFSRDRTVETAKMPRGAGLGLSISKALVERMGGALSFETKEGEGTTFTVDLPALAA